MTGLIGSYCERPLFFIQSEVRWVGLIVFGSRISWKCWLVFCVTITFLNHCYRVSHCEVARWFLDVVGKGPDYGFAHFNDDVLKDLEAHGVLDHFAVEDLDSERDVLL